MDANVLCEATRPSAERKVLDWLGQHDASLHVSVITLGEIMRGIQLLPKGRRRTQLERWLVELTASFEGRILGIDLDIMNTWAELHARSQRTGRSLPSLDSLVAATALHHDLTVVTRNTADFPREVDVLNPR